MSFEWGWNWETVVVGVIGIIVVLVILQIGSHLMTDVASKEDIRRIIREELQRKEDGER